MAAEATGFLQYFGGNDIDLSSKSGTDVETVKASTLNGDADKIVGFYFSAHWCPPCKAFTPNLVSIYKKNKEANKDFEIVFISSDNDADAFNDYYKEMPWLALPYELRDLKNALSKKFKVQGIPTLVFMDGTGKVVNTDGRSAVTTLEYPYKPPTFAQCIGANDPEMKFVNKEEKVKTFESMKADGVKYLAIYFSAHWCGPCRGFTPKLKAVYEKLKAKRDDFEFIFVSSDRDENSFKDYLNEMPWYAMPFSKRKSKELLSQLFNVNGIPHLCVCDMEGNVIRENARSAAEKDKEGNDFPWNFPAFPDLSDGVEEINDYPTFILLQDGLDEDKQKTHKSAMEDFVKEQTELGDEREFLVYTGNDGSTKVLQKIRQLTKCTGAQKMIILDIPDKGGFYEVDLPSTKEGAMKVIDDYRNKKLDRKQLQ